MRTRNTFIFLLGLIVMASYFTLACSFDQSSNKADDDTPAGETDPTGGTEPIEEQESFYLKFNDGSGIETTVNNGGQIDLGTLELTDKKSFMVYFCNKTDSSVTIGEIKISNDPKHRIESFTGPTTITSGSTETGSMVIFDLNGDIEANVEIDTSYAPFKFTIKAAVKSALINRIGNSATSWFLTPIETKLVNADCYGALHIIDIADPINAAIEKSITFPEFEERPVLFSLSSTRGYAFANSNILYGIDFSVVDDPKIVDSKNIGTPSNCITIIGNLVYILDSDGLSVYSNADDLANSVLLGGWYCDDLWAHDFIISGDYAYVTNKNGVHIIDISNPSILSEIDSVSISYPNRIIKYGNYCYVTVNGHAYNENNYLYHSVQIVDVGTPEDASVVGTIDDDLFLTDQYHFIDCMYVNGNELFLGANTGNIFDVSLSDPVHPTLLKRYSQIGGSPSVIYVDSSYVYAGNIDINILTR